MSTEAKVHLVGSAIARKEDKRLKCVVCYATSDDGLAWTKPNLGLFPFFETKETNIVLIGAGDDEQGGYGDRYCNSVLVDPRETDPARRYKMAYYDWAVGKDAQLEHLGQQAIGKLLNFAP